MYVDWEYYKIFYYVAKYQNFTRAARVLGNNQPNITHAMNRLESQLNCVLFIRSNRGVTLTPEGELLYSRIASAAVQIQDAEEELSATATLEHGAISISTTETAGREERRGGFCHRIHAGRGGARAENGGAEVLL